MTDAYAGRSDLPRVRIVYLVSADRTENREYTSAVQHAVLDVQRWYARQLGGPTFRLGHSIVEVVKSGKPASWFYENENGDNRMMWGYNNTLKQASELLGARVNDPRHVWVIYSDGPGDQGRGGDGVACLPEDDLLGLVGKHPSQKNRLRWIGGLGHELGHAFGLTDADRNRHPDAIMSTGMYHAYPDRAYLTEDDQQILMESSFFYHANGRPVLEKGRVVARFTYGKAAFNQHAGADPIYWTEINSLVEFTFVETSRDDKHIYIYHRPRRLTIRLPIRGGQSEWTTNEGEDDWVPWHVVTPYELL
jgi:hypothetical protein